MSKKTPKKEEQQVVAQNAPVTPIQLISQAIGKGNIDSMERLFNLQERWEKNQAKKAYDEAMSRFQASCPIIKRKKEGSRTKSGQLAFKYAPLELIVKEVQPVLRENDLSYDFKPEKNDAGKIVAVRCYAKHKDGHSDFSEMPVSEGGGTPIMSNAQIVAANISFSKRHAFCNIFGIVTEDEDNEKALQSTPVVDVEGIKAKFDKCTTIPQMKKVRDSLTPDEMKNVEIVEFANAVIKRIKEDIPVVTQ